MLVGQRSERTWLPNPPGDDWLLIGQNVTREWVPNPDALGDGAWHLVDVRDRSYFLADGNYQHLIETSVQQKVTEPDGISDRIYDPDEILTRTPGESGTDIKVPYHSTVQGSLRVLTKLVRYDRWEDQTYLKPWTRYYLFKDRTRQENTYRFQWKDPITHETLNEIDPNVAYTAWVYGAPYRNGIESQGKDPAERRVSLPQEDREEVYHTISTGVSSLTAANAERPGTFQGDSGSGGKSALNAGKLRAKLGANQVKPSAVMPAPEEGGLTIDGAVGTWRSSGGQSAITIHRNGSTQTMRVTVNLVLVGTTLSKEVSQVPFGPTWQADLGEDSQGMAMTLSGTFDPAGTQLSVKLIRGDGSLVDAAFSKQ